MGEPSGFLMPELVYLSPIMGHTLSPEALSDLPLIDQSPNDYQPSSQPPVDPHQDEAGKPGWQTPSLDTRNTSWSSGRFEPPAPAWNAFHSPKANPPHVFGCQPHLGPETSDYPLSSGRFTSSVVSSGPNWAWSKCVKALREHDHHVVQGWKEDVDSLLVFAGLFSAVVTAFNVESYKLLQEDPDERTASLLARISAQLEANYSTKTSTLVIPASDFHVDARSVRINTLWFSSLVLSLVSASIGILTKQWLREYTRNAASSPRENARIRQLRQEGLTRWKIPLTIALLPFLLQVAMALFFAGLLDLLWSLHHSVASVITVLVATSLSFLIFTTLMPTFSDDCPYKSPQALGAYLVMQGLAHIASFVALKVYRGLGWDRTTWPLVIDPLLFRRGRRRLAAWLLNLVHRRYFASWREREMAIVHDTADRLDHRVLADADATFMEDDFLWRTISFCLNDMECPAALHCLHEILAHRADRVIDGVPFWRHRESVDGGMNMLLHLVLDILPRIDSADSTGIKKALSVADNLCRAIPFETEHWETIVLYQRLFDELAKLLTQVLSVKMRAFGVMRKMWARSNAPVRPPVVQRLILLARAAQDSADHPVFHAACEMVLAFATTPTFSPRAFDTVRNELGQLCADLEHYLAAQDTLGSGQSASLFLALAALDERAPGLVGGAKLRRVVDEVRGRCAPQAETEVWRRHLAHARQLREFRERHPHASMTRQRNATGGRANALDLQVPPKPARCDPLGPSASPKAYERSPEKEPARHYTHPAGSVRSSATLESLGLDVRTMHSASL